MQLKAGCHHSIKHQGQEWHKDEEAGEQHPKNKGRDNGEGGDDDAGGLLFAFDVVLHGVSVFDYTCKGKVLFCQVLTIVNRFKKIDCNSPKELSFAPALVVAYCAGAMEVHSAIRIGVESI